MVCTMRLALSDRSLFKIAEAQVEPWFEQVSVDSLSPTEDLATKDLQEVADMAELMHLSAGWPVGMPEISVLYNGGGEYLIVDGHHRWLAAQAAGLDYLPAKVYPEDWDDLFDYTKAYDFRQR